MQNKHKIVATILVFLNINLACLHGPIKKKVAERAAILPKVNNNPNFTAATFATNKNIAITSRTTPRQKEITKPQKRYFAGNEGHAESFVKAPCAVSDESKLLPSIFYCLLLFIYKLTGFKYIKLKNKCIQTF